MTDLERERVRRVLAIRATVPQHYRDQLHSGPRNVRRG